MSIEILPNLVMPEADVGDGFDEVDVAVFKVVAGEDLTVELAGFVELVAAVPGKH